MRLIRQSHNVTFWREDVYVKEVPGFVGYDTPVHQMAVVVKGANSEFVGVAQALKKALVKQVQECLTLVWSQQPLQRGEFLALSLALSTPNPYTCQPL